MLILTRSQIAGLLSFGEYVEVVEAAFRAYAEGRSLAPGLMHVAAPEGEFHVKAGGLLDPEPMFALKSNGSFFRNRERYGLPNIQGMIVLADAGAGPPVGRDGFDGDYHPAHGRRYRDCGSLSGASRIECGYGLRLRQSGAHSVTRRVPLAAHPTGVRL